MKLIESIVEAWVRLRTSAEGDSALLNLRRGQLHFFLTRLSPSEKIRLQPHLESVANAGEPAIAVVEELLRQYPSIPQAPALAEINSACGGLFLLVRTVQDLRLSTLLQESGFDSLDPMLVALSIRFSGPAAALDGNFDAGAALWAGINAQASSFHLSRLATLPSQLFRHHLAELLAV